MGPVTACLLLIKGSSQAWSCPAPSPHPLSKKPISHMMINLEEKKIKVEEYHNLKGESGLCSVYVISQNATVLVTGLLWLPLKE